MNFYINRRSEPISSWSLFAKIYRRREDCGKIAKMNIFLHSSMIILSKDKIGIKVSKPSFIREKEEILLG